MRTSSALIAALFLSACATAPGQGVNDPYEPLNRQVHAFNRSVDGGIVRPLSKAARGANGGNDAKNRPDDPGAMTLVSNFSRNLSLPGKVVNHLLQGRPEPAVRNTFRFLVNSTLGGLGMFDPASADFALPEVDTDFGETLHVWGVPEGAYLELPILGPSTERDAVGKVVDMAIDPLGRVLNPQERALKTGMKLLSKAGDRARFGSTVDSVLHESADSYAQTRLLYLEHRRYELKQEQDAIDPYAD